MLAAVRLNRIYRTKGSRQTLLVTHEPNSRLNGTVYAWPPPKVFLEDPLFPLF